MRLKESRDEIKNIIDYKLLLILILMMVVSLIAIYSAKPFMHKNIPFDQIFTKQIIWYVIGFITMAIMVYNQNESLVKISYKLYFVLMILLVILLIDHYIILRFFHRDLPLIVTVNGVTAWYHLPGLGTFQPSEFMKVVLVIISADIIYRHNTSIDYNSYVNDVSLFWKIAKYNIPALFLIFMQPDTGLVIIILISISAMMLISSINKRWIYSFFFSLASILGIFFGLFKYYPNILEKFISPTRLSRIYGWLYPEIYKANSFQFQRAIISYSSGGIYGHGFNNYTTFVLEGHTDFIFASMVSATGLIGGLVIILLQFTLSAYFFYIILKTDKLLYKYMLFGFMAILAYQQCQNIGMILGLLPITGITLPLISYGGSSILSYFIIFGILMCVSVACENKINFHKSKYSIYDFFKSIS